MTLAEVICGQFSLLQYIDFFTRILAACFCGGLVGLERSKRLKEAGIRTHIVVCCGAALMMIVSKYAFADLPAADGTILFGARGADPSRIASQVASGISFLGVGVIFRHGSNVKGLTTAAGLWATAGIGLAVGAGLYPVGLFTTVTMVAIQVMMHHISVGGDAMISSHVQFTVQNNEDFQTTLDEFLRGHKIQISSMKIAYLGDGLVSYDTILRIPYDFKRSDLNRFLQEYGQLREISYTTAV